MIINTIPATDCTPQTIVIGRRGTYDTMQIAFDLSYLVESYGNGVAVLAVKRSQDESAYPAIVTQEDETLLWIVNETDTAYVGSGECQLMWYVDGGLAKTIIYPMVVMRDILQTAEQPPDGYENWIEHLTELGAKTQQNAQNAAQSASDASTAKDDAVTAKEAAEAAQEAAETAVTHYPVIINGYWNVWSVETQTYVSTGIKAKGEDGYSPEVTITTITGGHRVTITDKDHPTGQSFDVLDGQGGGGSSDYATLSNKPKINNVELDGNKTAHDLGLAAQTDIPTVPVQSVNGKTGAVNLASGDIAYDESATYQDGSVGAELQEQNRQLSDIEENQIPELKNAISQKEDALSIVQKASSDVTITLEEDKFYIFPTMTELTVTCPLTGLYGFRFTSGTTPTVFLMSGITMPDSWNGTEAGKTYDMTILNGLALVTSWSV